MARCCSSALAPLALPRKTTALRGQIATRAALCTRGSSRTVGAKGLGPVPTSKWKAAKWPAALQQKMACAASTPGNGIAACHTEMGSGHAMAVHAAAVVRAGRAADEELPIEEAMLAWRPYRLRRCTRASGGWGSRTGTACTTRTDRALAVAPRRLA